MTTFKAQLKDAQGNVITTDNTTNITLSLTSGTGGSFGGTLTQTVALGVATFNDITHTQAENITIKATEDGSGSSFNVSQAVTVNPGAFSLSHSVITSGASVTAGASTVITLTAKDANDNANPSGITSVLFNSSMVGGTGSFGAVTNTGNGVYTSPFTGIISGSVTLGAKINGSSVTSTPIPGTITVDIGAATHLVFTQQPSNTVASANISPDIKVSAEDAEGNIDTTYSANVSMSLACSQNHGGGLAGTTTQTAANGVATFNDLQNNGKANGCKLTATDGSLTNGISVEFEFSSASTTKGHLTFTQQPTNTVAGDIISPNITVEERNANDVLDAGATDSICLFAITTTGAEISMGRNNHIIGQSQKCVDAVAGVATFSQTYIRDVATGLTLKAHASQHNSAISNAFNITPATYDNKYTKVAASPSQISVGQTSTVTLTAKDIYTNQMTSGGLTVVFGIGQGSSRGSFGATTDHGDGTYSAVFTATAAGSIQVHTTVGGVDGRDTDIMVVSVPGNHAPVIDVSSAPSTLLQGASGTLATVTDADLDSITLTCTYETLGLDKVDPNFARAGTSCSRLETLKTVNGVTVRSHLALSGSTLTWIPSNTQRGTYKITLNADDGNYPATEQTVTVVVQENNVSTHLLSELDALFATTASGQSIPSTPYLTGAATSWLDLVSGTSTATMSFAPSKPWRGNGNAGTVRRLMREQGGSGGYSYSQHQSPINDLDQYPDDYGHLETLDFVNPYSLSFNWHRKINRVLSAISDYLSLGTTLNGSTQFAVQTWIKPSRPFEPGTVIVGRKVTQVLLQNNGSGGNSYVGGTTDGFVLRQTTTRGRLVQNVGSGGVSYLLTQTKGSGGVSYGGGQYGTAITNYLTQNTGSGGVSYRNGPTDGRFEFVVGQKYYAYKDLVLSDRPMGYWRLGDNTTTATDLSAFEADGTYNGGYTQSQTGTINGDSSKATLFNGSTSYVTASPAYGVAGTFTVEAWVKPAAFGGTVLGTLGGGHGFQLSLSTSNLIRAEIGDGSAWMTQTADATTAMSTGTWYHVVCVVTPTDYWIYKNGTLVGSGSYASSAPLLVDASHPITMGEDGTGAHFLNGTVQDVAIYKFALSDQQIANHYNTGASGSYLSYPGNAVLADHPVGYWRLGEKAGLKAFDSSGSRDPRNTGRITGNLQWNQSGALSGDSDGAAAFDGSTSFIQFKGSHHMRAMRRYAMNSGYTLEAWAKPITPSNGANAIIYRSGPDVGIYYQKNGGFWAQLNSSDGTEVDITGSNMATGTWHHLVMTVDAYNHQLHFYIDGSEVSGSPSAFTGDHLTTSDVLYSIGARAAASDSFFGGNIDEVSVYDYPLSSTQVLSHYQATPWWFCRSQRQAHAVQVRESQIWSSLQAVYDGTTATLMVNGQQDCQVTPGTTYNSAGGTTVAGANQAETANFWSGLMASLKLFGTSDGSNPLSSTSAKTDFDDHANRFRTIPVEDLVTSGQVLHLDPANADRGLRPYKNGCGSTSLAMSKKLPKHKDAWFDISPSAVQGTLTGFTKWNSGFWEERGHVNTCQLHSGAGDGYAVSDCSDAFNAQPGDHYEWTNVAGHSENADQGCWRGEGSPGNPIRLDFNGTSAYVTLGDQLDYNDATTDRTITAWVKSIQNAARSVIVGKGNDATKQGYWLSLSSGKFLYEVQDSSGHLNSIRTQAATYNDGHWHYVVATSDGTGTAAGKKIYVDGALVATDTLSATGISSGTLASGYSLNVGSANDGKNYFFQGAIGEVMMYSRALTAQEVKQNCNGQEYRFTRNSTTICAQP